MTAIVRMDEEQLGEMLLGGYRNLHEAFSRYMSATDECARSRFLRRCFLVAGVQRLETEVRKRLVLLERVHLQLGLVGIDSDKLMKDTLQRQGFRGLAEGDDMEAMINGVAFVASIPPMMEFCFMMDWSEVLGIKTVHRSL